MKKTQTKVFADLVGSIIFIILGIWAWIQTSSFQEVSGSYVQASTFPLIMIVGMLIFSVILLVQSVIKLLAMKGDSLSSAEKCESINPVTNKGVRAAFIVVALCVAFVALFQTLGYVICSAVIAVVIMYLIGKRDYVQMIIVSILVPLGMWLIFYKVLTVNIPMGPLQFLRDLLDKF